MLGFLSELNAFMPLLRVATDDVMKCILKDEVITWSSPSQFVNFCKGLFERETLIKNG